MKEEPKETLDEVKEPSEEHHEVAEEPEEEIEVVEERIITLNMRKVWIRPRKKRASRALRVLRENVKKQMKVEDVRISNEVNEAIWSRGAEKPPRKVEVKAVKDKDGNVIVFSKA